MPAHWRNWQTGVDLSLGLKQGGSQPTHLSCNKIPCLGPLGLASKGEGSLVGGLRSETSIK